MDQYQIKPLDPQESMLVRSPGSITSDGSTVSVHEVTPATVDSCFGTDPVNAAGALVEVPLSPGARVALRIYDQDRTTRTQTAVLGQRPGKQ